MSTSISDWLREHELGQFAQLFIQNEIDLATLLVLDENDLKELGLAFGPRRKLIKALRQSGARADAQPVSAIPEGERRHLTVLLCDLVGYTELTRRVDPESIRTIVQLHQEACDAGIRRYDGHVYQRLGDAVIGFFGYPEAHEDDASRAVRAALDIVQAMAALDVPEVGRISVRIGIDSGTVVIDGTGHNVVGEPLTLAHGLQGVARPNSTIISDRTLRLVASEFDYDDLGDVQLGGISGTSRAAIVTGVGKSASRFEAAGRNKQLPMVGREHEMHLLRERWQSIGAKRAGEVILISGEPGIGKSRVADAIRLELEGKGATALRFQCSPFYSGTAFYPMIANFERRLGFGHEDTSEAKFQRLEALIVEEYGLRRSDARFPAAMLSLPHEERYGPLTITPRFLKEEMIRVMVEIVRSAAQKAPCVMFMEDIHWADPSTFEALDYLLERLEHIPVLLVMTHRPDFEQPWWNRPKVGAMRLDRLSPEQSREMVMNLAGGQPLPPDVVEQIVVKTEGIPLFVEELTRTILESGQDDHYIHAGATLRTPIPTTLTDSLMARLDRAGDVKRIAQVGAVIGREFDYELVAEVMAKVMNIGEPALSEALSRLVSSQLAARRGMGTDSVYTFKHALVQDVAYNSLLKAQRAALHDAIADVIEKRWPETRETKPELLAKHYTEAERFDLAIPSWRRAGQLAMQRFALKEAIGHLRAGLALVDRVPPGPERDLMELELRSVLGPAVMAQEGWARGEVADILEPARAINERLKHRPTYVPVLHTLWVHYLCVDRLALSLASGDKLLATGRAMGDENLEAVGYRAVVGSYYWLGEFERAREAGNKLRAMYDPKRQWSIAQQTNNDPLTGDGIYRGQYLWMLGYPDQARQASDEKDAHARRRNHPFDLAFALTLGAQLFDYLSEPEELLRRTQEAEEICRRHRVDLLGQILVEISYGIVALRAGRAAAAELQLNLAVGKLEATGHRIWVRYLRGLQAEARALTGDLEAAQGLIEKNLLAMEYGEERVHHAELLRLKGWVLALQGRLDQAAAALRAAIEVARRQQAKSWELRATTTLARVLAEQGMRLPARQMLADVYGWFREGFSTRDLKEAKALLDTLADGTKGQTT